MHRAANNLAVDNMYRMFSQCSMAYLADKLVPVTDDELAQSLPSFGGKTVRPDLRDEARRHFVLTLVEHLRRSKVRSFRCEYNHLAGKSTWSAKT